MTDNILTYSVPNVNLIVKSLWGMSIFHFNIKSFAI